MSGRIPSARLGAGGVQPFALTADDEGHPDGHGGSSMAAGQYARSSLRDQSIAPSAVSNLYFSPTNVNALHEAIRYRVYIESGARKLVIGKQSDVELALIMRSVYLQSARNVDSEGVVRQVRALNAAVLDYCVPRVLDEAISYLRFRQDVSTLPEPLPRGELATTKGERSLSMAPGL